MPHRIYFMGIKNDELVKSPKTVTPVKTGVQNCLNSLDSCFCRNDKTTEIRLFTISLKIEYRKNSKKDIMLEGVSDENLP